MNAEALELTMQTLRRKNGSAKRTVSRKIKTSQIGMLMNEKNYEYDAVIYSAESGKGGAYVRFPHDIRAEFGRGRVKVTAIFDGEPYEGSIVNMGVKNEDGSVCYIIGVRKDIRAKIGKQAGDVVRVTVSERKTK